MDEKDRRAEAVAKPEGSSQPAKPAIQSTTPYGSYVREKEAVEPEKPNPCPRFVELDRWEG